MLRLNTSWTLGTSSLQLVQALQINNQHSHSWWGLISGPSQTSFYLWLKQQWVEKWGINDSTRPEADLSAQLTAVTWSQPLLTFATSNSSDKLWPQLVWWQFLIKERRYNYIRTNTSMWGCGDVSLQKGDPVMLLDAPLHQHRSLLQTAGTSHSKVGTAPAQPMVKAWWTRTSTHLKAMVCINAAWTQVMWVQQWVW